MACAIEINKSLNVEIGQWSDNSLKISTQWIRVNGEFWFFVKEFALSLEYTDPKNAIRDLIDLDNKKTIEELLGENYKEILERSLKLMGGNFPPINFIHKIHPHRILTNELGLYEFCSKSRKLKAKSFQKWIYDTIVTIRKTGFYTLPGGPIDNPMSLINKVSNLEREIKSFRIRETCDKSTQTSKSVITIDGSFREFENRMETSLKKNKSSIKKSLKKTKADIKRYIKGAKLDIEKSIRRISSDSSSSHSYYNSDSD